MNTQTEWKSFDNDWPEKDKWIYIMQPQQEPQRGVFSQNAFYPKLNAEPGEVVNSINICTGSVWCYSENYVEPEKTKRPPLGLPPLIFILEQRQTEIIEYINRCTEEGVKLKDETVMELQWVMRAHNEVTELGIGGMK